MTIEARTSWIGDLVEHVESLPIGTRMMVHGGIDEDETHYNSPNDPYKSLPDRILEIIGDDIASIARTNTDGTQVVTKLIGTDINDAHLTFTPVPGNSNYLGGIVFVDKSSNP